MKFISYFLASFFVATTNLLAHPGHDSAGNIHHQMELLFIILAMAFFLFAGKAKVKHIINKKTDYK